MNVTSKTSQGIKNLDALSEKSASMVLNKAPEKTLAITKDALKINTKNSPIKEAVKPNIFSKFADAPMAPYTKENACYLFRAVITDTTAIRDEECSTVYLKTPLGIAKDIANHEKLKSDPELKEKVEKFLTLLDPNDKAALAYTETLLDRRPPISMDTTKKIFESLTNMMSFSFPPEISDNKTLAISALHDIAMPMDISQEGIGTCAGTSVQIQLAIRSPVEYLNMLHELAKNEFYTSPKGVLIGPNLSFINEGKENFHDSKRTISSKIMQNAIMDFADGSTRNFNSAKKDEGITTEQTTKALNDIIGLDMENLHSVNYTSNQIMDVLVKSKPSLENPIEISLAYEKTGRDVIHSVNVVALDEKTATIANPWGREETFPVAELEKRILSISKPKNIETKITSVDIKDPKLLESLAEDTKGELVNKISIEKSVELIQETYAPWNGEKYDPKDLSDKDKKAILNIIQELTKGDYAQSKPLSYKLKHFAPDLELFLSKIDNKTEQFNKVKEKLLLIKD